MLVLFISLNIRDGVTEGTRSSTNHAFLRTSQQMLLRCHWSLKDFPPRWCPQSCWCQHTKPRGTWKDSLSWVPKRLLSKVLDSETTEREAQKTPHESLIKIFYKHRATEVEGTFGVHLVQFHPKHSQLSNFMFLTLLQRANKNKHNHNNLERDIKNLCDLDKNSVKVNQIKPKKGIKCKPS